MTSLLTGLVRAAAAVGFGVAAVYAAGAFGAAVFTLAAYFQVREAVLTLVA